MLPRLLGHFIGDAQDTERKLRKAAAAFLRISHQVSQGIGRPVVEIPLARIDYAVKKGTRQCVAPDSQGQRLGDLMATRLALVAFRDSVAPPLQADLSQHRFRNSLAGARDLGIESVKREQVAPPFNRSK